MASIAGDLRKVDDSMSHPAAARDGTNGLLPRAALLSDLGAATHAPSSILVCRIDQPQVIVDEHGAPVLERVVIALARLLKGTFGTDTRVYRTSTQCVAMFLPRSLPRQVAQQVRNAQARVAPEYEYERNGVTRRVVFTFSSVITSSPGRTARDSVVALERAEARAEAVQGLSQLQSESGALGRLVGWLSPGR